MDFYEMQPGDRVSFVGPQWSPGPHFRRDHWTYHLAHAISMAAAEAARTGRSINGARQRMGPRLFPAPAPRMSRSMAQLLAVTGVLGSLGERR